MRKRCRLKPITESTDAPVEIQVTTRIDDQTLDMMSKINRPSVEQCANMINAVIKPKSWTQKRYSIISGIEPHKIRKILDGTLKPSMLMAKNIFLIYTRDAQPEHANNLVYLATFGMTEIKIPAKVTDVKAEVESFIKEWRGSRLTTNQIHHHLCQRGKYISPNSIRAACKAIGYVVSRRCPPRSTLLDPNGVWLKVDWRQTNASIARRQGLGLSTVSNARIKLKKVGREALIAAFLSAGRENAEVMAEVLKRS